MRPPPVWARRVGLALGVAACSALVTPQQGWGQNRSSRSERDSALVRAGRPVVRLPELRATVRTRPRLYSIHTIEPAAGRVPGATIGEWLRTLPGVQVRGRGAGGAEGISIRGSRAQDVRVTLDGMPLADPLTGATDLSLIAGVSIERATLTSGAGASPGWGGTAGTLSLESRDPAPGARVAGFVGAHGRRATVLEAGWKGSIGSLGVLAQAEGSRNDYGFRNRVVPEAPLERRVNADRDSWNLLARARLEAVPLSLVVRSDALERGAPGGMANHVWDDARWRERRTSVGAAWGLGSGARIGLSWAGRSNVFRDGRSGHEERLHAEHVVTTGATRVPGGVDVQWEGAWARVDGDRLVGRTRLTGGVRASRVDRLTARLDLLTALSIDGADEGVAVSPSAGLRWELTRAWAARIRASQARRLPTFADLFLRAGVGVRPNPDLRPEKVVLDAEVGLDWSGSHLSATSTVFRRRLRDPIIWLPSVISVWTPRNLGRLDAIGVELSGAWRSESAWRVEVSGTWQRSHIGFPDGARSPLPYEPRISGSLRIAHDEPHRGVAASLNIVGRRSTNMFGPQELPAYGLLNIRARQTFQVVGLGAEIHLGLVNALDAAYERVELFPEPGRRFELGLRVETGVGGRLPRSAHDPSFSDIVPGEDGLSASGDDDHAHGKSGLIQKEKTR